MNALANPFQPFTSAEFHKMVRRGAFNDMRVELRRGMIVKMSPKHLPHVQVQADLVMAFGLAIKAARLDWKVGVDATVSFGSGFDPDGDIVLYDLTLVADKTGPITPSGVKLVVEVADTSLDDDMGEKRDDYARFGLAEYWVADVNAKLVHMHAEPRNGAFAKIDRKTLSEPLAMLTRPDIVVQIA
ncbi:MAG: Uma2 family endonuclease [Brevundimonas sp.]